MVSPCWESPCSELPSGWNQTLKSGKLQKPSKRSLGADADHTLLRAYYQRARGADRSGATRIRMRARVWHWAHAVVCACATVCPCRRARESAVNWTHKARTYMKVGAVVGAEVGSSVGDNVGLHNGSLACKLKPGGMGMLALPYRTLCSAKWEGWPSDHSARALANDYICMAHYNAHSQAMCISPTADGDQSQRRCWRVAAQMRASSAADVGQCRCRWDGVGDSASWCGRAGRRARFRAA